MFHGKISGFMLFESVGFTLTVKKSLKYFNFFRSKKMSDLNMHGLSLHFYGAFSLRMRRSCAYFS